jgi:hypothetical protein
MFRKYPVDAGLLTLCGGRALPMDRTRGVVLPTTEAGADANTFVCEFVGGASANETGVGLGLAGADLVFTQVGSVGASSAGFRPIADVNKRFTCTVPFLQAWANGSEWTLMRRVKGIASTTARYLWYIAGTASLYSQITPASYLALKTTWAGPAASIIAATSFSTSEYWEAAWKKGGIIHYGFVLSSSANPPSGWDSFPPTQRSCVRGITDFTADAWGTYVDIVGSTGASAVHEIGVVVASKIGLAAAPV